MTQPQRSVWPPFKRSGTTITQRTASDNLDLLAGNSHFNSDAEGRFGGTLASPKARVLWETADANANALIFSGPAGGATDVPAFLFGDDTLLNKDVGLFNGVTNPVLAVMSNDATKAIYFDHDGSYGNIYSSGNAVKLPSASLYMGTGSIVYGSNGLYSSATSSYLGFGGITAADTFITYDETTAQFGAFLGSASGRQFIIGEATYNVNAGAVDYDHAVQSNPTLYLQSVNSPNVDNRQWVKWYNDGSNSYHLTGIGGHLFGFEAIQANAIMAFTANPTTDLGVVFTVNTGTITGTTAAPGANQFQILSTLSLTLDSLVTNWNLIAGTGVVAHKSGNTVVFEASTAGIAGNSYVTTETTDTDGVYSFQKTMIFTANPTTTSGIVFTVGTGTLTGVTGTPAANQFLLGATLSETVASLVRAYNALAVGINAIVNENPTTGYVEVIFDAGTTGVSIFTETTDTDNVYSFASTVMSGGRTFSSFMAMQPGYLKLTKTGIATAGTTSYNSQYLGLTGSAWDTDDLVPRDVEVRFQTTAASSATGTGSLNVSHWRNGVITATMFTVNSGGTVVFAGNVNSTNAVFGTTATTYVTLKGNDADDASGIGVILDAATSLTTAGSRLVSVRNANVEKAYVDYLGSFNAGPGTTLLPAYSFVADPNTGIWNSAGDTLAFVTNGTTRISLSTTDLTFTSTSISGVTTIGLSGDLTDYEASNGGNPSWFLGSSSAERLEIQSVYDAGAQTLDYVQFQTYAASGAADKGKYMFGVDGTDVFSVVDSGVIVTNATSASGIDVNTTSTSYTTLVGAIDLNRSGAITGVDTEVLVDNYIHPTFTLTEPGAGTFNYNAMLIDISGISVTAGAGGAYLSALRLVANADADAAGQLALYVSSGKSRFDGAIMGSQGTDIASASTIVIPTNGNVFELTGVTAVNLITKTGWQDGMEVMLVANENVTINHATATAANDITILLSGGANFAMTANDTLTLVLCTTTAGGQAWREKCRTAI